MTFNRYPPSPERLNGEPVAVGAAFGSPVLQSTSCKRPAKSLAVGSLRKSQPFSVLLSLHQLGVGALICPTKNFPISEKRVVRAP